MPSSKDVKINLKGIMVGNACTDPDECYVPGDGMSLYQYEFLWKHAYFTDYEYDHVKARCSLGYDSTACQEYRK